MELRVCIGCSPSVVARHVHVCVCVCVCTRCIVSRTRCRLYGIRGAGAVVGQRCSMPVRLFFRSSLGLRFATGEPIVNVNCCCVVNNRLTSGYKETKGKKKDHKVYDSARYIKKHAQWGECTFFVMKETVRFVQIVI